jgi:hypothetical protein
VSYPIGTPVTIYSGTEITAPAIGDTSIALLGSLTAKVGDLIAIWSRARPGTIEYRAITAIGGGTVSFDVPLGGTYSGTTVAQVTRALRTAQVYTKGGVLIGAISKFNVTGPRSRMLMLQGQASIQIPVNHPDALLVADDRLITLTSDQDGHTWLGSMGRAEWTESAVNVSCPDAFDLLTGAPIHLTDGSKDQKTGKTTIDELTVDDGTKAAHVFAKILKKVNDQKAKHCEVQWTLDDTGCTKVFRGDLPDTGDAWSYISLIAERSQTEFAWRADGPKPVLMVRDKFDAGAGPAIFDGPGGNVETQPTVISDPSQRVSSLKLTGAPTFIAKWVPAWGGWAVHEVTPEVDISVKDLDVTFTTGEDCDGPRWRRNEEVSVDWSLSRAEQKRLAALTTARLWRMFYSFLYAYHDLNGMPFYDEKWSYEGPPAEIEMDLTLDQWHTRNQLGLYHTSTPAHIVMDSEARGEFVIVVYFRSTGTKVVFKLPRSETYTYPIPTGTVPAGTEITIYIVSGDNSAVAATWTSDGVGVKLGSPQVVDAPGGAKGNMTVREMLSGPFSGHFVNTSEAPWVLAGADESLALQVGGQIGKIWPFERDKVVQWDPRRDGIGKKLSRASVLNAELRTIARWRFVQYTTGGGVTSLTRSVGVNDTVIFVEGSDDFPEPPFDIVVGEPEGNGDEGMTVTHIFGSEWSVKRGTALNTLLSAMIHIGDLTITVDEAPEGSLVVGRAVIIHGDAYIVKTVGPGSTVTLKSPVVAARGAGTAVHFTTSQLIHDEGQPVSLANGDVFDGFKYGYKWPEGEAYARDLLKRLAAPRILLTQKVATRGGAWNVDYGSMVPITYTTEGPLGPGWTGTGRVIGWAPDEESGTMELMVEAVVP